MIPIIPLINMILICSGIFKASKNISRIKNLSKYTLHFQWDKMKERFPVQEPELFFFYFKNKVNDSN